MKTMKKIIASVVLFLTWIIAMASICSACFFIVYQPELPQKP